MDKIENSHKVPVTAKVDASLAAVLVSMAEAEDRTLSNMTERLLKTHPRVEEMIAEAAD